MRPGRQKDYSPRPEGRGRGMARIKPHHRPGLFWEIETELAFSFEQLVRGMTLQCYTAFPYGEAVGFAANGVLQDYFIFIFYANMHTNGGPVFGPAWERDKDS